MIDPRLGQRLVRLPPDQYAVGDSVFEVYVRADGRKAVRDITGYPYGDGMGQVGAPPTAPAPAPAKNWLHRTFDPWLKSGVARAVVGVLSAGVGLFGAAVAFGGGMHAIHGGFSSLLGGGFLAGAGATGVYVTATYKPPQNP